jgi:L-fucose isomerase-like protein
LPGPVRVIVAAAPLDWEVERGKELLDELRGSLAGLSDLVEVAGVATAPSELEDLVRGVEAAGVAVYACTGGTDRILLRAREAYSGPLLLFAHMKYNALASLREAVAAIRRRGGRAFVAYGSASDFVRVTESFARAAVTAARLRGLKLGIIGKPEPWLLNVPDPEVVENTVGVKVVRIEWDEMLREGQGIPSEEALRLVDRLKARFGRVEVGDGDLEKAVRLYLAMKRIVERHGLAALAVEARDMLVERLRDWGPYLGVALLSDDGIPADYEADVEAVLTKLVVYLLTGQPSFMANITVVKRDDSTVLFSHCTVPPSMTVERESVLTTYFETGRSVAIRGKLREGERVTFTRIALEPRPAIMVGTGVIVNGDVGRDDLCRTQIIVRVDGDVDKLIEGSLGNHTIVFYGDHANTLRALAEVLGWEVIRV